MVTRMLIHLQLAILTGVSAARQHLPSRIQRRNAATQGQAFLEYALVLAVVAVIVLVAVQAFGADLGAVFERIRNRLGSLG
jgi:Flp pilus assembly pilin Flp